MISVQLSKSNYWKWYCFVCKLLCGSFSLLGDCILHMNGHIISENHIKKQTDWRKEFLQNE